MFVRVSREEEEEETAAITDPEGKPVKDKSDASKTTQQTDSKESQVNTTFLAYLTMFSVVLTIYL